MKNKVLQFLMLILTFCLTAFTFTACHEHVFNMQNTADDYLCGQATCESKALYYYSCECGVKGTETFEYGEVLGHDFSVFVNVKTPATCTASRIEVYKCSRCDKTEDKVISNSANGHSYNKKVILPKYKFKDATCESKALYYYSCECGVKGTETFEYGEALNHDYSNWVNEGDFHSKTCSRDASHKITASHTPSNPATETQDQICIDCSAVLQSALGHVCALHLTYYPYKDSTCTSGGNYAYYACTCQKYYLDSQATQEIVNVNDVLIGKLNHDFSTLNHNESQHYLECECGEKERFEDHYGGEATCKTLAVCEGCGNTYGNFADHKGGEWIKTEYQHFKECIALGCRDRLDFGVHNFDEDKKCVDCGYVTSRLLGTELLVNGFTFNGTDFYCEVASNVDSFSFSGVFSVANEASYKILKDGNEVGQNIAVNMGENRFIITVFNDGFTPQNYSLVIYRKYVYTVQFDTDGGSEIKLQLVEEGGLATVPNNPVKTGYDFIGWDYDFTKQVTENITIKAKYQVGTYSLTVKRNNGQEDIVLTKTYGEEIPELDDITLLDKQGYAFVGWTEKIPTEMPGKDTIINAVWELMYEFEDGVIYSIKSKYVNQFDVLEIPAEIEGVEVTGVSIERFGGQKIIIPSTVTDIYSFRFISAEIIYDSGCNVKNIHDSAFLEYKGDKIVIPETVESLGRWVFSDCYAEIEIKTTKIKEFGEELFADYKAKSFVVPYGVKSISSSTFYRCENFETLVIPSTVESIGVGALSDCKKLVELTLPFTGIKESIGEAYKLGHLFDSTGFTNYDDINARLPKTLKTIIINGDSVVQMEAFNHTSYIETLILGDSVEKFIVSQLSENKHGKIISPNLTEIRFGKNLNTVSEKELRETENLQKITVDSENQTFESSGGVLFTKYLEKLVCCPKSLNGEVYLGKNTKVVDVSYITKVRITGFNVDDENPTFKAENGVLYSKDGARLIKYPEAKQGDKFVVPYGVEKIENAINYTNLAVLVISDTVKEIVDDGIGSVYFNDKLKVVLIGKKVTTKTIFINNPHLAVVGKNNDCEINVSNDTAIYNIEANDVEIIGDFAFVTHNPTQTNWIFGYLGNDTNVILPDDYYGNPYKIANNAFTQMTNIESITLGAKVIRVDGLSFYGCDGLLSICVNNTNDYYKSVDGVLYSSDGKTLIKYPQAKKDKAFNIPEGVTEIQNNAFLDAYSVTDLTLPSTLEIISDGNMSLLSLNYVELGGLKYVKHGDNEYGVVIGSTRDDVEEIKLRDGCKIIYPSAFYEYDKLKKIELPESIINVSLEAFYGCKNLSDLKLSSNLKEIGENAFTLCDSLTTVTIPNSVEKIGYRAFSNCSNLKCVYFGSNSKIKEIGAVAFAYNPKLKTVHLERENPLSLTVGEYCFYEDTSFINTSSEIDENRYYTLIEDGDFIYYYDGRYDCLFDYVGSDTTVVIPEYITKISDGAFMGNTTIKKVVMTDVVEEIGEEAFSNCSNLEEVILSNSIKQIKNGVFYSCYKLNKINLPENLTTISEFAFAFCYALEEVVLPNGVTYVGSGAYLNCRNLFKVTLGENVNYISSFIPLSTIYDAFGGCDRLACVVNNSQLRLEIGSDTHGGIALNALFIDEGENNIERVGDYLFVSKDGVNYLINYLGEQTNIVLPNDYHGENYVIRSNALSYKNLDSVEFTNVVISIEKGAFYENADLMKVNFVGDVNTWCERKYANGFSSSYDLYIDGELITEVLLTNEISMIDYAFSRCNSIVGVNILSDVVGASNKLFYGCNNIRKVNYLGTLDKWAENPIENDFNNNFDLYINGELITELIISCNTLNAKAFRNCGGIKKVVILDTVEYIGYDSFANNESIEYIELPYLGEKRIDAKYNYFGGIFGTYIYNQQHLNVPPSIKTVKLTGITSLPNYAFYNITTIEKIILPSTLKSIGEYAFYGCTAEIVWEGTPTIQEFGDSSFYGYAGEELIVPDSVVRFSSYATGAIKAKIIWGKKPIEAMSQTFADYKGDVVTFPVGVKNIYQSTFSNCNVEKIIIPKTVTHIESGAFMGCTSKIYFEEGSLLTTISSRAFQGYLGDTILLPDGVTEIEELAFVDSSNLTDVYLGNSITELKSEVFLNCSSLESIVIPNSVERLSNRLFFGCDALKEITLGKNIKDLGFGAFVGLTAKINWHSECDIKTINSYAFSSYKGEEIAIPATVTAIDSNAFYECSAKIIWADGINIETIKMQTFLAYKGEEIIIPSSVTAIEYGAFLNSTAKVVWPSDCKITAFNDNVFHGYMGESISVPPSIEQINANIFVEHSAKVIMESENFIVENGGILSKDGKTLLFVTNDVGELYIVPSSVEFIAESAFYGVTANVVFEEGSTITQISKMAFYGYMGSTVILPNTVTTICESAFYACVNLTDIVLPSNLKVIEDCAFESCVKLKRIVLPDSVETIGYSVFYGCERLVCITLGRNLKDIGYMAVSGAKGGTIKYNGTVAEWKKNTLLALKENDFKQNFAIVSCLDGDFLL